MTISRLAPLPVLPLRHARDDTVETLCKNIGHIQEIVLNDFDTGDCIYIVRCALMVNTWLHF
jgi:hypothetical protein